MQIKAPQQTHNVPGSKIETATENREQYTHRHPDKFEKMMNEFAMRKFKKPT